MSSDDEVVAALGGHPQPIGTVKSHLDNEPFGLQAASDGGSDLAVVLEDEHFTVASTLHDGS